MDSSISSDGGRSRVDLLGLESLPGSARLYWPPLVSRGCVCVCVYVWVSAHVQDIITCSRLVFYSFALRCDAISLPSRVGELIWKLMFCIHDVRG